MTKRRRKTTPSGQKKTVFTTEEKRQIIAKVLEIGVRTVLENHVYKFGNKIYRQVVGGPMGLKLTRIIARLVMDRWARQFEEKLQQAGVHLDLIKKYVDDMNIILKAIGLHLRWNKTTWRLEETGGTRAETQTDEETLDKQRQRHTFNLLRQLASSITTGIEFTADTPSEHENMMVPMLDMQT